MLFLEIMFWVVNGVLVVGAVLSLRDALRF